MIKLKNLICESQQLSVQKLANAIKYAYVTIFDIDEVEIVKSKDLMPPSFAYTYMTVSIVINYRGYQFLNYHKLLHYKFPKEETENLSSEEWRAMLIQAEKFPHEITTEELVKGNNPLIVFNSSVNEATHREKITGFEMFNDLNHLGDVENKHNILALVTEIKTIIDKYGSDSSGEDDKSPIVTPPEKSKLVTV